MSAQKWQELLSEELAKVLEELTQSSYPYEHQRQAIEQLVKTSSIQNSNDFIINGGTYSGKSLSFTVPGIVKLLTGELDFFVVFYPSKQLLLDQFDRIKELLVMLERETGKRLTVKKYSGDINRRTTTNRRSPTQSNELYETEQHPPTILLATFDKVWYQIVKGETNPLLNKIMSCQYLVFDEIHAFEGFAAAIIRGFIQIHKRMNLDCQIILSSATIDNVVGFRDDFLPGAEIITCPPVRGEQEFLGTTKEHAVPLLTELWQGLETLPGKLCLVFLDSKEEIELLTEKLCLKLKQDYSFFDTETVAMIHADLPYSQRKKVLDEIRKEQKNKIRILISSSVLELGVNLPNVQSVVNIGIPITQKDGIVQRMARNRSKPGERRVNTFLFDVTNPRDSFYWEHLDILQTILETNACNPILYPRQNAKILAGLFVLHLRYGITDFEQIMLFFLKDGVKTHELARQQYAKLVCYKVLKKEHGKVLFTGEGVDILVQQMKKNNVLVPFSIRAISTNWTIELEDGLDAFHFHEGTRQLGKISIRDVLKKGLPGNLITRNKLRYLVTDIDHQQKSILVKQFLYDSDQVFSSMIPTNQLFEPTITMGIFPKKIPLKDVLNISFGQLTITRKPNTIINANPERKIIIDSKKEQIYSIQDLTKRESEELAITEQVEGIQISLVTDIEKPSNLSNKQLLKLLGEILLLETEMVLSIPKTEFGFVYINNQLAIYDKGEPNGNTEYLFQYLQQVVKKASQRLNNCPCKRGCKCCYGEILGLLPEGAKEWLVKITNELAEKEIIHVFESKIEEQMTRQNNYQEDRIIALSDIHLTSKYCYQEEFFVAINSLSKEADIIIINGDLLDKPSKEGREAFCQLQKIALKEGFWSKLVFIRSSTIHDATIDQSTTALYLDYALIETSVGEVLFIHGNKIGLDPEIVNLASAEQAAIKAKTKLIQMGREWLPRITKETHLVIGHLHQRFYNERFRVYGLGHWTHKGNKYHQKCYLKLDNTSTFDSLALFQFENQ